MAAAKRWFSPQSSVSRKLLLALVLCSMRAGMAAAEPAACLSSDPKQWPQSSKPYFLVVVDTSASMGTTVPTGANSCSYQHNRLGDARCAVKNMVNAYGGLVDFGLVTYAWKLSCPAGNYTCNTCDQNTGCFTNASCTPTLAPNDNNQCGPIITEPNINVSLNASAPGTQNIHAGGYVVVPVAQDNYWNPPLTVPNVDSILATIDNNCGNSEIGAFGLTPLGGVLYNMNQYLTGTYHDPFTTASVSSPIGPAMLVGNPAERTCRSINVILITDGDESCDSYNPGAYPSGEGLAVFEAGRLFSPGVTVSGQTFGVKTYVIGFAGATAAALNNIASAGGTTTSFSTANETQLFQALSNIIGGTIKAETCDNLDNNCNGCTDEGYPHYADVGQTCCALSRPTCLTNYANSISAGNPKGNTALLPCTTVAQAAVPATWLCYNPGDQCDLVDNNGNGQIDESITKCGNPLHCPQTEVCNGRDDDCDGQTDEGNVCAGGGTCLASAEICDGCDNDCDGFTDNGIGAIPCGPSGPGEPGNCQGLLTCKPGQVVAAGGCAAGGYNACSNSPQTESCDGLDNDCNGIVDDNIPPQTCTGTPGLVYGGTSQCQQAHTVCIGGVTSCQGGVGPSTETCDGIDNDCNGQVDDNIDAVGHTCGSNIGACQRGIIACVSGALTCQGGVQPQAEICDGIDNDCDGAVDGEHLCSGGLVCHGGQCVTP